MFFVEQKALIIGPLLSLWIFCFEIFIFEHCHACAWCADVTSSTHLQKTPNFANKIWAIPALTRLRHSCAAHYVVKYHTRRECKGSSFSWAFVASCFRVSPTYKYTMQPNQCNLLRSVTVFKKRNAVASRTLINLNIKFTSPKDRRFPCTAQLQNNPYIKLSKSSHEQIASSFFSEVVRVVFSKVKWRSKCWKLQWFSLQQIPIHCKPKK